MLSFRTLTSISIGGTAGAGIRWLIIETLGDSDFPWAIFAVNVLGSALLGCLLAELIAEHSRLHKDFVMGLASGFCGSLTTFSLFAVEIAERFRASEVFVGIIYAAMSVGLGLIAGWWGYAIRSRADKRKGAAA